MEKDGGEFMLDFDKALERLKSLTEEEELEMFKKALEESGIPFEECDGRIIVSDPKPSHQDEKKVEEDFLLEDSFDLQRVL